MYKPQHRFTFAFSGFPKSILSIQVTYCGTASNSASTEVFNVFLQWIFILKKSVKQLEWDENLQNEICFLDFWGFSKSNLSMSCTYSSRAFHSALIDVLRLFLQWILRSKKAPNRFQTAWKSWKEGLSLIIDGFQNRTSLWAIHILLEHLILHQVMCWMPFCNGFLSWKKLLKHLKMHENLQIKIISFGFWRVLRIESLYGIHIFW